MKKITATFPDSVELDFNFLAKAIDLKMETIEDTAPDKAKVGVKHRDPNMTTSECLIKHYTPEGIFQRYTAQQWLRTAGFAESSISATTSVLKKAGLIRDLGGSKYQWIKAPDPKVRYGKRVAE